MIESFSPVDLTASLVTETLPKAVKSSKTLTIIVIIVILTIIGIVLLADYLKNRQSDLTKQ